MSLVISNIAPIIPNLSHMLQQSCDRGMETKITIDDFAWPVNVGFFAMNNKNSYWISVEDFWAAYQKAGFFNGTCLNEVRTYRA